MSNNSVALFQLLSAVIVMAANVVLTLLTYRYVRLTGGMLDHMRRAQAASVDVDIMFREHDAYLNVVNRGNTAATHIKFEALSGFEWAKHSSIPELRQHGISYLPAGRTLRFWLGFPDWDLVKKEHLCVKIGLAYEAEGSRQRRDFVIDMTQYLGTSFQSGPEDRIVDAIDRLRDALPRRDPFARMGLFRPAKKACIMCAESIPAAAKICSHCQASQENSGAEAEIDMAVAASASDPVEAQQSLAIAESVAVLSTPSTADSVDDKLATEYEESPQPNTAGA